MAFIHATPQHKRALAEPLLAALFAHMFSNFGYVRTLSQYLWLRAASAPESAQAVDAPLPARAARALRESAVLTKLRVRTDEYMARYHPLRRCTVAGLLVDVAEEQNFLPEPLLDALRWVCLAASGARVYGWMDSQCQAGHWGGPVGHVYVLRRPHGALCAAARAARVCAPYGRTKVSGDGETKPARRLT
jgi:hypothetical protein